ncbi:MAG: hypothetical protein ABH807_00020 [Candidatus Shapirobacteria bacterium]
MSGPDVDKLGRQTLHDADPQMTARRDALFKAFSGPVSPETEAEVDVLKTDPRLDTSLNAAEKAAALEALDFEGGVVSIAGSFLRGIEKASRAAVDRRLIPVQKTLAALETKLERGQTLTLAEQGQFHAAYIIVNNVFDVVSAARPAQRIGGHLETFRRSTTTPEQALDDQDFIERTNPDLVRLPHPAQLEVLGRDADIAAALDGQPANFFGRRIAEVVNHVCRPILPSGATLRSVDLVAGGGLDLGKRVEDERRDLLVRRAPVLTQSVVNAAEATTRAAYVDQSLDYDAFCGKLSWLDGAETRAGVEAAKTGARNLPQIDWGRLSKIRAWRKFVEKEMPEVFVSGDIKKTQTPPEIYLWVLDQPKVREKIVELYGRFTGGEIVAGSGRTFFIADGNWGTYNDAEQRRPKWKYLPMKDLTPTEKQASGLDFTMEEQMAMEVLNAWLVCPPKVGEFEVAQTRDGRLFVDYYYHPAWAVYFGAHNNILRAWYAFGEKFKDHPEALAIFRQLFGQNVQLPNTYDVLNNKKHPEKGKHREFAIGNMWEFFVGFKKIREADGSKTVEVDAHGNPLPEFEINDLITRWDEIKRNENFWKMQNLVATFWDTQSKAAETALALDGLLKVKRFSPKEVYEKIIGPDTFKYIPDLLVRRNLYRKLMMASLEQYEATIKLLSREGGISRADKKQLIGSIRSWYQEGWIDKETQDKFLRRWRWLPERGSLRANWRNPNWWVHHRIGIGNLVGAALGEIAGWVGGFGGNKVKGPKWEAGVKRYVVFSPVVTLAVGVPALFINFGSAMAVHGAANFQAIGEAVLNTFLAPGYREIVLIAQGYPLVQLPQLFFRSPALWLYAANFALDFVLRNIKLTTKSYEDQRMEETEE